MRRLAMGVAALALAAPALAGRGQEWEWAQPPEIGWAQGPTLGVQVTPITPELRKHFGAPEDRGVLVASVVPDSAAAKAGIQVGDVITEVGGDPVGDVWSLRGLLTPHAGSDVKIGIVRDNKEASVSAKLGGTGASAEEPDRLERHMQRVRPGEGWQWDSRDGGWSLDFRDEGGEWHHYNGERGEVGEVHRDVEERLRKMEEALDAWSRDFEDRFDERMEELQDRLDGIYDDRDDDRDEDDDGHGI